MLHVNGLTFRIGPRVLFDNATVALPPDARVGFLGRNGTGKTTLFRIIMGEASPDLGSVSVPSPENAPAPATSIEVPRSKMKMKLQG